LAEYCGVGGGKKKKREEQKNTPFGFGSRSSKRRFVKCP
jgi:hypothetical protein